jgi:hypothetical protein
MSCRAVSQILNQNQIISALFEGALRDVQKPHFITWPALLESFRDVRRNRNRRAAHLVRKAIDLTPRETCREGVGRQNEPMALLPYYQILKCLCWFCHAVEIESSFTTIKLNVLISPLDSLPT